MIKSDWNKKRFQYPKANRKKTIQVRLTEFQYKQIIELCNDLKITTSKLGRELFEQKLKDHKRATSPPWSYD